MRATFLSGTLAIAAIAAAQPKMMPYTAVDHPGFVPAAQATFLSESDVLIGVARGAIARAYPAADVAQHGVIHDQMPDGPIAVTW